MAFGLPGRSLGHAPPPPRPFGRFGGIVAVDADRLVEGLSKTRLLLEDSSMRYRQGSDDKENSLRHPTQVIGGFFWKTGSAKGEFADGGGGF